MCTSRAFTSWNFYSQESVFSLLGNKIWFFSGKWNMVHINIWLQFEGNGINLWNVSKACLSSWHTNQKSFADHQNQKTSRIYCWFIRTPKKRYSSSSPSPCLPHTMAQERKELPELSWCHNNQILEDFSDFQEWMNVWISVFHDFCILFGFLTISWHRKELPEIRWC